MSFKIVAQYYKEISFEIPDAKTALLLDKDIVNYKFVCDISSKTIKEKIIEISVNLKLSPIKNEKDRISKFYKPLLFSGSNDICKMEVKCRNIRNWYQGIKKSRKIECWFRTWKKN